MKPTHPISFRSFSDQHANCCECLREHDIRPEPLGVGSSRGLTVEEEKLVRIADWEIETDDDMMLLCHNHANPYLEIFRERGRSELLHRPPQRARHG